MAAGYSLAASSWPLTNSTGKAPRPRRCTSRMGQRVHQRWLMTLRRDTIKHEQVSGLYQLNERSDFSTSCTISFTVQQMYRRFQGDVALFSADLADIWLLQTGRWFLQIKQEWWLQSDLSTHISEITQQPWWMSQKWLRLSPSAASTSSPSSFRSKGSKPRSISLTMHLFLHQLDSMCSMCSICSKANSHAPCAWRCLASRGMARYSSAPVFWVQRWEARVLAEWRRGLQTPQLLVTEALPGLQLWPSHPGHLLDVCIYAICIYTPVYICIYIYVCIYMYVYIYIYLCLFINIYIYIYMSIYK